VGFGSIAEFLNRNPFEVLGCGEMSDLPACIGFMPRAAGEMHGDSAEVLRNPVLPTIDRNGQQQFLAIAAAYLGDLALRLAYVDVHIVREMC
jgi:hypothetical protein